MTKEQFEQAVKYVKENIDMDEVEHVSDKIYKHHSCLRAESYNLYTLIYDLMCDFCDENELDYDWDEEYDEEDIFLMLLD